jgi:CheY-like chemotaxis protein
VTLDRWVVLLVEDEALIRLAVAEDLRAEGFQVIEARDAADAMSVLRSGERVDLLFTDVQMPGQMDGVALAAWTRDRHIQVLLAITSGDPFSLVRARERFPNAFILPKPVNRGTAAALFKRHLGQRPTNGQDGAA